MMSDRVVLRFASALRRLKKRASLTSYALSKRSGVNHSNLRGLERGRHAPTWRTVLALAKALDVSVEEFA
jgi:transcriptional regulator with XRE-family HTH domain